MRSFYPIPAGSGLLAMRCEVCEVRGGCGARTIAEAEPAEPAGIGTRNTCREPLPTDRLRPTLPR
jgi:hypothetical protein